MAYEKSLEEAYYPSQDLRDAFGIQEKWLKRRPSELSGGNCNAFRLCVHYIQRRNTLLQMK